MLRYKHMWRISWVTLTSAAAYATKTMLDCLLTSTVNSCDGPSFCRRISPKKCIPQVCDSDVLTWLCCRRSPTNHRNPHCAAPDVHQLTTTDWWLSPVHYLPCLHDHMEQSPFWNLSNTSNHLWIQHWVRCKAHQLCIQTLGGWNRVSMVGKRMKGGLEMYAGVLRNVIVYIEYSNTHSVRRSLVRVINTFEVTVTKTWRWRLE